MIVSRIDGGLGNQMFQYAFGLYLSQQHQTQLALDLSSYDCGPQHGFMLDRFRIIAQPAEPEVVSRFPKVYLPKEQNTWLPDWVRPGILRRVKERPFGFHLRYLQSDDNSYLVGYWQSERFFPGLRKQLLEQFQPQAAVSKQTSQVIECMHNRPSIGLHVRRGDYVQNPTAAKIYEQVRIDYYRQCLHQWAGQQHNPEVYIFSNDMAWCREHFQLPWLTHFVSHVPGNCAYEDLLMMSHCNALAIANSTFSWWSAYLNQRSERTIFAPRQWFRPFTLDATHLYPDDWQVVDGVNNLTYNEHPECLSH